MHNSTLHYKQIIISINYKIDLCNFFCKFLGLENDMSSITELLSNVDKSLEKLNIDSSSCVQRIICSYVNDAQKNLKNGEASTIEEMVSSITR